MVDVTVCMMDEGTTVRHDRYNCTGIYYLPLINRFCVTVVFGKFIDYDTMIQYSILLESDMDQCCCVCST
jgi:hypothetical protein